jgi:hypothetical protein
VLILAITAIATSAEGETPIPALKSATAAFASTSLSLVAKVKAEGKTYDLKCGTLAQAKTCTLSPTGQEAVIARSTNIVFDAGDGFTVSSWDPAVAQPLRTIVLTAPK